MNDDAAARRLQLGRLLRRARETVGLTQTVVAQKLGCGQAKITKIETTLVGIDRPELETLLEMYGLPPAEADELRKLAELDRQQGPVRTRHANLMTAFGELSELEPEAREIRCWHSERIPGPLQSEMYILKQHEPELTDSDAITRVLRARTARTKVFTVSVPPPYRVILSESSLYRMPGGRNSELMADQAEHLLRLLDAYRQLQLQILTFDANIRWVDSDFELLLFNDPKRCDFVYIEYPGGTRKCKSTGERLACAEHWTALSAAALDQPASRKFLNGLAGRDESSPR